MGEEGYVAAPPAPPGRVPARAYDGFVPATKPKKPAGKAPKDATAPGTELFLIDGNSLAYRAFFALPEDIATSDGRPTNAIYGFASMMVKILVEHQPKAVVVVWDAGMSGREVVYEPYKEQRKPRPDLLKEQWPHIPKVAEAFGFTNVRVEGFEADDVIAALARSAQRDGIPVMVVSGDRDVYQLVGDGIRVMTTSRGITDTRIYDHDGVVERYGVPPELVPDLIGLKGDTSDNIPGVPGIGDKTATALLQEFGSLEAVLDNVDSISGKKRKENLTNHADDARVSKQLATMQDEIETGLDLGELMTMAFDRSRLRDVAAEFELRVIIQRLEDELPGSVPVGAVADEIEIKVGKGTIADLAEGPIAVAARDGRWGATDGKSVVEGETHDPADLADELRGRAADRPRRQVARRDRARGAARRHAAGRARPPPRHDGRRLPDRPVARASTTFPTSPRPRASPPRGPTTGDSWRSTRPRASRRATRPPRRGSSGSWPRASATGSTRWG